jgi:hypothetical protein
MPYTEPAADPIRPDPWRAEYLHICHATAQAMAAERQDFNLWMRRGEHATSGKALCLPGGEIPPDYDAAAWHRRFYQISPPMPFKTWRDVPLSDQFFALFWALRDVPVLASWAPGDVNPFSMGRAAA